MSSQSPLYGSLHSKSLHQRVEEDRRFMVGMTALKSQCLYAFELSFVCLIPKNGLGSQLTSLSFPPFYFLLRTLNSMPTPLPGLLK
jgi:hypothetical protein